MLKRCAGIAGILAALACAPACNRQSAPGPDVWAVVNAKEIRREQVEKYFRTRVSPQAQQPSHEESLSLMLNILEELINNEVLLERAQKMGLEAADGEVEDKFTELKSPYTEEEFQRQLKERGVTVDDLKRDLRRQLSIQKLINREVINRISISEQDITDFYNQNRPQFNIAETQYRVAQILVTPRRDPKLHNRSGNDAGSEPEARRKITALAERLKSGADFAQVAMDYSEDPGTAATGGDLGYIPESSLNRSDAALKKTIVSLKQGEISGVIALRDGYRILKLLAREPPGQRELSDPRVQQSIRDTLRNRKEQLLRSAYLAVARDQAKVTNFLAQQLLESAGKLPEPTVKLPPSADRTPPAASPGKP